ncbi:hypothetical protein TNCV_1466931 [Trichonephila clavipes]|nr:hypothetical protein TNCV_1466931 [Trichonephila clavipes]
MRYFRSAAASGRVVMGAGTTTAPRSALRGASVEKDLYAAITGNVSDWRIVVTTVETKEYVGSMKSTTNAAQRVLPRVQTGMKRRYARTSVCQAASARMDWCEMSRERVWIPTNVLMFQRRAERERFTMRVEVRVHRLVQIVTGTRYVPCNACRDVFVKKDS